MDFDEIISAIQSSLDSPTLDTDYTSPCDTLAVQPLPQPSCSNQSLALLKAFCSDEDTVKSYLLDDDTLNNQNNKQFVDSPTQTSDYCTENLLNFNDQTVQPHGLWAVESLTSTTSAQAPISSSINTDPLAVNSNLWIKINDEKFNLKSDFILLVKRGYKLILSLVVIKSPALEQKLSTLAHQIAFSQFCPL